MQPNSTRTGNLQQDGSSWPKTVLYATQNGNNLQDPE